MSFLTKYKPLILEDLKTKLLSATDEVELQTQWIDVFKRLSLFSENGKMARGSIFLFTCTMFGKKINNDLLSIASAIEIFHGGILIHDDIMDLDRMRRGGETVFVQYENELQKIGADNPQHIGKSLAICAGDIGFFLAYQFLSETKLPHRTISKLTTFFSKELVQLGITQMIDCVNIVGKPESEEEVLSLYKNKTARYTFSLPFIAAALVCNQPQSMKDVLFELGEQIGIMFQIQDELLGLFGDEKETGKAVGADIRENRKTLYKTYLYEIANKEESKKLNTIFGNKMITAVEIEYVRSQVKENKVDERISKLIENYHTVAAVNVEKLSVSKDYKKQIQELITFIITRTR
ncbi:MAG: polyprenyl synthetase family protein [Patescibacteria group bacterium]